MHRPLAAELAPLTELRLERVAFRGFSAQEKSQKTATSAGDRPHRTLCHPPPRSADERAVGCPGKRKACGVPVRKGGELLAGELRAQARGASRLQALGPFGSGGLNANDGSEAGSSEQILPAPGTRTHPTSCSRGHRPEETARARRSGGLLPSMRGGDAIATARAGLRTVLF